MTRSRARSEVKWLVNEATVLAGELQRLDAELARLGQQRQEVENAHRACLRTLTIVFNDPFAEAPLPPVHTHRSYGKRGRLRQFIRDTLKEAAPAHISTEEMVSKAIRHFGLTFDTSGELRLFKNNSFTRALRHLEAAGSVEAVGSRVGGVNHFGAWRWKSSLPALPEAPAPTLSLLTEKGKLNGAN